MLVGRSEMESGTSYGNESMESDLAYGDEESVDYGLELDVEPSGGEDEEMLVSSSMEGEFPGSEAGTGIEPYEGMEFENEEETWTFYNMYARRVGFNTRISVYHRSRRDGSITSRQFVCAKEGFRTPRQKTDVGDKGKTKCLRAITRVGCRAMIRVRKQDNGKWVVAKFQKMHNHALVAPSRVHCIRSHRLLSETARSVLGTFHGPQGSGSMSEFRDESLGIGNIRYTRQDHISYSGLGLPSTISSETQNVLDYCKRMRSEDSSFFYAVQFEEDHCVGNVFWADAKSRMSYKYFGDVLTFDMSYKTNQYQIPFAFFAGVNHHRHPVLFGCALLVDDSESSLVWLFRTLLLAMSDRKPTSIISDHDRSVQAAVAQVFPGIFHRLCRWHMLKEGQEKLAHVYHVCRSFQGEVHKCINMAENIGDFETCWGELVSKYNLEDNEWLQSAYNCRCQWVPLYLRGTFFAEMTSMQRCESRSSFFEGYINAQTTSQMLIQQYGKALESRYEKEIKADFDTIYTLPVLKTPSPMEKQAAELYTRKLFKKFQEEFLETFIYTANKISEESVFSIYKVVKFDEEHKSYTVMFNASEKKAMCSCQMFEHSGILCRHILTVFSVTGVLTLPAHYIMKRWTRNAKSDEKNEPCSDAVMNEANCESQCYNQDFRESLTWCYNSLCREAIKYAEDGASSIDIYNVAVRALQEAVKKITVAKKNVGKALQPIVSMSGTSREDNGKSSSQHDDNVREEGMPDPKVSNSQSSIRGRTACDRQTVSLEGTRLHVAHQEVLLFQRPLNFVLVSPSLPSDSLAPVGAGPLALTIPNGQALSNPIDNSQVLRYKQGANKITQHALQKQILPSKESPAISSGNESAQVNLPPGSILNADSKNTGSALQASQAWNAVGMGHGSYDPGNDCNKTSSALSKAKAQVMGVPMALYVPMAGNLPITCSASTNAIASEYAPVPSTPSMKAPSLEAGTICTTGSHSQDGSKNPSILPKLSNVLTNPIHTTAIAAGEHMVSPCVTLHQ